MRAIICKLENVPPMTVNSNTASNHLNVTFCKVSKLVVASMPMTRPDKPPRYMFWLPRKGIDYHVPILLPGNLGT